MDFTQQVVTDIGPYFEPLECTLKFKRLPTIVAFTVDEVISNTNLHISSIECSNLVESLGKG